MEETLNLNSGVIFKGILLKFGGFKEDIVFYEPLINNLILFINEFARGRQKAPNFKKNIKNPKKQIRLYRFFLNLHKF